MIRKEERIIWHVEGFRRYRPDNPLSRSLITAAPWVNAALLIAMYLFLAAPNVLQPGMIIHLPEASFGGGSRYGHNLVILSQAVPGKTERQEMVFFDDERFLVDHPGQIDALGNRLARAQRNRPEVPMVIEADKTVQHGTVVHIFNMASAAGFKEVNVAIMPSR
jgi:biopolymer transport protein ExbD